MKKLLLFGGPHDGHETEMAWPVPLMMAFADPDVSERVHLYMANGPPSLIETHIEYDYIGAVNGGDLPKPE